MAARRLIEDINIITAGPPSDFNSDFAGDYVDLKNYDGCLVVMNKVAGTAGDDPSLQLYQSQDVAATGEKALTFGTVYYKIGATALTSIQNFTRVDLTTPTGDLDLVSVNSADLLSDVGEGLFVIDVKADSLDVTNGFHCICFKNDGTDIGNATYANVLYILYGARYPGALPIQAIA